MAPTTESNAKQRWRKAYEHVKTKNITEKIIAGGTIHEEKTMDADYMIADFETFQKKITEVYENCKGNEGGKVAAYIPELAKYAADNWGISVCTVDGKRFSIGKTDTPFPIQSCCKPLNYALSLTSKLPTEVHRHVGMEPSGRLFNELTMDTQNRPHNPMVNAGAIMVSSLTYPHIKDPDERLKKVMSEYKKLAGNGYIGYNEECYLSEKRTAFRNYALAYLMRENNMFPEGTDFEETMNLYFKMCSIEITAESGAVIAATLANGGYCPTTNDKVLKMASVRSTLSLMLSCGMYDYSGQFAFKVGLPCKSGVSGVLMLVVPNVAGICLWSPPLDACGNSVRGLQFCEELVTKFTFHHFDNMTQRCARFDPCVRGSMKEAQSVMVLMQCAAKGNLETLRRLRELHMSVSRLDLAGRSALHVAAAEGHLHVVKFLVEECGMGAAITDRWGHTPSDEAKLSKHEDIMAYLDAAAAKA